MQQYAKRGFSLSNFTSAKEFAICAATIALVATQGCSSGDIPRAEVHGRVTLDGNPIAKGQIRFVPTDGPVWLANVQDGKYSTAGTKGVPKGDLRVEIQAFRTPAGFDPSLDPSGDGIVPMQQYLPPKFNLQSELKMTIAADADRVEKDFELSSR
jgi:hypothetical protein